MITPSSAKVEMLLEDAEIDDIGHILLELMLWLLELLKMLLLVLINWK